MQSPGFEPDKVDFPVHASTYKLFQSAANCTSLKCLRQAPTAALLSANEAVILKQDQTDFGSFGPVVDGDYVPDIPMKLIAEGKFHQLESIISANNGFEVSPGNAWKGYEKNEKLTTPHRLAISILHLQL